MRKSLFLLLLIISFLPIFSLKAAEFDPSYLISDSEMNNYNSMNQADILRFLEKRSGTLKNYLTFDKENNPKTASQAFYEIAQRWMINPKYLLVLVQKEQSLLEDFSPTQKQYDWATGYGVCDSCSMDDPNIQRFKGFYRQVNSAAAQTRYYMDNIKEFNFQPGKTYNIDGQSVTIKNTATAGLYNYTPHINGNKIFWNLWNKYFGRKWPDGSLLQVEGDSVVYYIENGLKREIASKAVFISRFDPNKIITVSQEDLDYYESGAPIKYANFSLLQAPNGDIYMIFNDIKRKIESKDVLKKLGLNDDNLIQVSNEDLISYKDGPNITEYTLYPTGILVQSTKAKSPTSDIYYIISGQKRPVLTPEILNANFSGMTIKKMTPEELDKYMTGDNVSLPEGWLVKTKNVNTVYVISNGKRLPIFSGSVFVNMKYNSKNIKVVSEATLNAHQLGQTITGDW